MADTKVVVDCEAKTVQESVLTAAEQTALDAFRVSQTAVRATRQTSDANSATIRQAALDALAVNKAFYTLAKPATAAAQASAAFDAAQKLAKQQNGIIRLLLNQLDASD